MGRDDSRARVYGQRQRELREARGLTQRQLADASFSSKSRIQAYEAGKGLPTLKTAALIDSAVGAEGELVALLRDAPPARHDPSDLRVAQEYGLDEAWEIERRRKAISDRTVDEAKLLFVEDTIRQLITDNERRAPRDLAPKARQLRAYVDEVLDGNPPPRQSERLYVDAVYLCGLLGALALDVGLIRRAAAYTSEAFDLAAVIEQPDVQAWARGAQSLIAYYAGDYHSALAFALDGQQRAPRGPQAIRLAVNGEARALAKLGDTYGVDQAVDKAFNLLGDYPSGDAISPSLAQDAYCSTRAAANAATAYLALRQHDRVAEYAGQAVTAFDRAGMRGPQALSRLDLATAALMDPHPEPQRAAALAGEAMMLTSAECFESVNLRAREFMTVGQAWRAEPEFQTLADMMADRARPMLPTAEAT